jgi:DNA (cytosine-5)-methyltransferase 1
MPTFGSLFSGIGGLDLGLERAGWECRWQVEIDEWRRSRLAVRWPGVRRWDDVRTFLADTSREPTQCVAGKAGGQGRQQSDTLASKTVRQGDRTAGPEGIEPCCGDVRTFLADADKRCKPAGEAVQPGGERTRLCREDWRVDLIAGGFPCPPVSVAGRRLGVSDDRWLWPEFRRVVATLRPRAVLIENVPGLLSIDFGRIFGAILADLDSLGYVGWWHCVGAAHVGAPHIRDRVWVVAYAANVVGVDVSRVRQNAGAEKSQIRPHHLEQFGGCGNSSSDADGGRCQGQRLPEHGAEQRPSGRQPDGLRTGGRGDGADASDATGERLEKRDGTRSLQEDADPATPAPEWWDTEPPLGRLVDGDADRLARRHNSLALAALGDAVVPQVAEFLGRRLIETIGDHDE